MKKNWVFWIIGISILFSILACGGGDGDENNDKVGNEIDAYIVCQNFVEDGLKAPSTAKFARMSESEIMNTSGDTWMVGSYVDAQNSFGAMIRTYFVCELTYIGEGNYRLEDLTTR